MLEKTSMYVCVYVSARAHGRDGGYLRMGWGWAFSNYLTVYTV